MKVTAGVLAAILGLILLVGLSIAAWQLNWFVAEKNLERQVHLDNRNTGTQTAWHDEAINAVTDFETTSEDYPAGRGALRTKACNLIERLTDDYLDDSLASFQAREC